MLGWEGGPQCTLSNAHTSQGALFSFAWDPGQDLAPASLQWLPWFHSCTPGFPGASSEDHPSPPLPVVGTTEQLWIASVPSWGAVPSHDWHTLKVFPLPDFMHFFFQYNKQPWCLKMWLCLWGKECPKKGLSHKLFKSPHCIAQDEVQVSSRFCS